MSIKENEEYFGKMIHNWDLSHKNKYVITGMQQGGASIEKRIGRVAQVRLEAGHFGSDNVVLRHCNDELRQHSNQSFWLIPEKYTDYLNECFKDAYLDDSDSHEYTLQGEEPAKGFLIPSKVKEGESTPMRDIKAALSLKINETLKQ